MRAFGSGPLRNCVAGRASTVELIFSKAMVPCAKTGVCLARLGAEGFAHFAAEIAADHLEIAGMGAALHFGEVASLANHTHILANHTHIQ